MDVDYETVNQIIDQYISELGKMTHFTQLQMSSLI